MRNVFDVLMQSKASMHETRICIHVYSRHPVLYVLIGLPIDNVGVAHSVACCVSPGSSASSGMYTGILKG